jgi:hypothetical protein
MTRIAKAKEHCLVDIKLRIRWDGKHQSHSSNSANENLSFGAAFVSHEPRVSGFTIVDGINRPEMTQSIGLWISGQSL